MKNNYEWLTGLVFNYPDSCHLSSLIFLFFLSLVFMIFSVFHDKIHFYAEYFQKLLFEPDEFQEVRLLVDLSLISLVENEAMDGKDFIRTENCNPRLRVSRPGNG